MQLFEMLFGFACAEHLRQERYGSGARRLLWHHALNELTGEVMNACFLRGKPVQELPAVAHLVVDWEARDPAHERR